MRRRPIVIFALVAVVVGLSPIPARAQPLADRVPADAVLYVGWRGARAITADGNFNDTHLKGVLDASNIPQLFNDFLPKLVERVAREDADAGEVLRLVQAVGAPTWRHPSAVYFGGVDLTIPELPEVRLAILCDAGDDAPALVKQLQPLVERAAPNVQVPIQVQQFGNLVVVSTFAFEEKPAAPLGGRAEFKAAMGRVHKTPAAAAYVDSELLLAQLDLLINASGNLEAMTNWPKARAALGLDGVRRAAYSSGFDGKDWETQLFLDAPAPRAGLISLLDTKPVPDELLKAIPKSATLAAAGGFDLAKLVNEVRAAAEKVQPGAGQQVDQGLAAGSMMLGANIQKDLLEPLGEHWAIYCAPTVGGNSLSGVVLINRLDDAAKAERALGQVEILTNNMVAGQFRKKDDPKVAFVKTKAGDATIHYLAVPFVSPAWAVHGGNLYVGLYPQIVSAAVSQAARGEGSILDNDAFKGYRQRLGGQQAKGIQFLDLPTVAPEGYANVLALSRLALGFADMYGVPSPAMAIPPLSELMPHLAPVAAVSRVDDAGFHFRHVTPFPGAEALGTQGQSMVGQQALLVSILLPSLNRARETANRVKCASNMRQIGQAMLLYSNENKGKYPPDLGTLLKTQDVIVDVFVCPSGDTSIPAEIKNGTREQQAEWVNANSDFVYLGAGKNNQSPADEPLVYEKPSDHDGDGMNMLYGDGHVEFQMMPMAVEELGKLGVQMNVEE
jgi:prepilin-type processing-associated H-X9-DG protein